MQQYQNSLHFKFFPILVEGGVIENHFFPKFKKVQIILGGRGGGCQENYGLFPQFGTFFFIAPLIVRRRIKHKLLIFKSNINLKKFWSIGKPWKKCKKSKKRIRDKNKKVHNSIFKIGGEGRFTLNSSKKHKKRKKTIRDQRQISNSPKLKINTSLN